MHLRRLLNTCCFLFASLRCLKQGILCKISITRSTNLLGGKESVGISWRRWERERKDSLSFPCQKFSGSALHTEHRSKHFWIRPQGFFHAQQILKDSPGPSFQLKPSSRRRHLREDLTAYRGIQKEPSLNVLFWIPLFPQSILLLPQAMTQSQQQQSCLSHDTKL